MSIVDDIFQSFSLPFNPPVMRRVTWETINSTLNVTLCEILSPHRVGHPQTRLWGSNSWGDLAPDQTDGCDIFAIPDRHRSRASWWMEAGIFQQNRPPAWDPMQWYNALTVTYVCIIIVYIHLDQSNKDVEFIRLRFETNCLFSHNCKSDRLLDFRSDQINQKVHSWKMQPVLTWSIVKVPKYICQNPKVHLWKVS